VVRRAGIVAAVALCLLLSGCRPEAAGNASAPAPASPQPAATQPAAGVRLPPTGARFDYQLGGAYAPATGVAVVERDSTARPAAGRYNICYLNAFQTQPGELPAWKKRHPQLLLRHDGRLVTDPDWPDEVLLDTSSAAKRSALASVIGARIAHCAAAGFDAVEPDNLDSWTRSHQLLTADDNVRLAALLARRAHAAGLAIAQKNAGELGPRGRTEASLDFAVAEECQVYGECGDYTAVYGSHVIEIEYTDNGRAAFTRACAARGRTVSVLLRDRDVVPSDDPAYVSRWC